MKSLALTNALLILIAALLAAHAVLAYQQRPVTRAELTRMAQRGDSAAMAEARQRIPLVRVISVDDTVNVEVQNPTLSVEIER